MQHILRSSTGDNGNYDGNGKNGDGGGGTELSVHHSSIYDSSSGAHQEQELTKSSKVRFSTGHSMRPRDPSQVFQRDEGNDNGGQEFDGNESDGVFGDVSLSSRGSWSYNT